MSKRPKRSLLPSIFDRLQLPYYYDKFFNKGKSFVFDDFVYRYFFVKKTKTWRTERCVEIPIALLEKNKLSNDDVLEVGDVLTQYGFGGHRVIDLYAEGEHVENFDICTCVVPQKYKLVVCISTLEHINNFESAIDNMYSMVSEGGLLLITIPVGWNRDLEKYLQKKYSYKLLVRVGKTTWRDNDSVDINEIEYNRPFIAANAVMVLMIIKVNK